MTPWKLKHWKNGLNWKFPFIPIPRFSPPSSFAGTQEALSSRYEFLQQSDLGRDWLCP